MNDENTTETESTLAEQAQEAADREYEKQEAADRAHEAARLAQGWHCAPDGSDCGCTVEDRQYGCGCR